MFFEENLKEIGALSQYCYWGIIIPQKRDGKEMRRLIGGAGMKKGGFVWMFLLIAIFLVNAAEAKSLKKGEVYSLLNGESTIEVISSSELEITKGGRTIVAEYDFKGDKLRVVANVEGTKMVQYFLLTNEGLKDEETGAILYTKAALTAALERQRAEEKKRRAENEKRMAAERAALAEREKRIKERFTFSDLTGLDNETKLMRTMDANLAGKKMTWDDAFKFVESLNQQKYSGYSDWRLPSKEELPTLVNFAKGPGYTNVINEFFKKIGFKNVQADDYWSSTTCAGSTGGAWVVHMGDGFVSSGIKASYDGYVWPVRAGQ